MDNFNEYEDPFIVDWKRVRGLIEHEDDLIDQRTRWLTLINTFLFAGFYTIAAATSIDPDLKLFASWALPGIGLVVSVAAKIAIGEAMRQLKESAEWWRVRKKSDPRNFPDSPDDAKNLRNPPIVGIRRSGLWSHDFLIADVLPATAISLWILVFLGEAWKYPQPWKYLQEKPQLAYWQWMLVVIALVLLYWLWSMTIRSVRERSRTGPA